MLADSCSLCVVAEAAAEASACWAAAVARGAPRLRSAGRARPLLEHMEHAGAAPVATGCRTGCAGAACPCTSGRRQPVGNPGARPPELTAPFPHHSPRDHRPLQSLAPGFSPPLAKQLHQVTAVHEEPSKSQHLVCACQRAPSRAVLDSSHSLRAGCARRRARSSASPWCRRRRSTWRARCGARGALMPTPSCAARPRARATAPRARWWARWWLCMMPCMPQSHLHGQGGFQTPLSAAAVLKRSLPVHVFTRVERMLACQGSAPREPGATDKHHF